MLDKVTGSQVVYPLLAQPLPVFSVPPGSVHIIESPAAFRLGISNEILNAKSRIILASLYIGHSEKLLVNELRAALLRCKTLQVTILIDYFRGTRKTSNESSFTVLEELVDEFDGRVKLSLFHTPDATRLFKMIMPTRFNEILGLMHMKICVFDDQVIITGANLSKDYFINRQDRYIRIQHGELSEYFVGLVQMVAEFSYSKNGHSALKQPHFFDTISRFEYRQYCKLKISNFMSHWLDRTSKLRDELLDNPEMTHHTLIFPAVQLPCFDSVQDEVCMRNLLNQSLPGCDMHIASAYLNLPRVYKDALLINPAQINLISGSEKTNGFFASKGVSRFLPTTYSTLLLRFMKEIRDAHRISEIKVYEYIKDGFTWHTKGIWIFPTLKQNQKMNSFMLTTIGSSNMNYRSVYRDLEAQVVIYTKDVDLSRRISDNMQELVYRNSRVVQIDDLRSMQRMAPGWVKIASRLVKRFL